MDYIIRHDKSVKIYKYNEGYFNEEIYNENSEVQML